MYGNGMYPPFYGSMPGFGGIRGVGSGIGTGLRNGLGGFGGGLGQGILGGSRGVGLFSRLGRGFNLGSILTNTQKTLGVINQAIPVVKQAGPMMNNMKTMLKLASAFKDETEPAKQKEESKTSSQTVDNTISNSSNNYNQPEFFI